DLIRGQNGLYFFISFLSHTYYIFYFKLSKFLCYFILLSCIYTMLLAQKKPGLSPLVCSELLELIFSNLKIKDILYSCLTVNHQWNFEAFQVILKQKEREFCEDLDFIKYQLDCSEQEITRIRTVLYTPYY